MCGGTISPLSMACLRNGLSPHVRGNRRPACVERHPTRSIPACAGEPSPCRSWRRTIRVYPRMCGGTARTMPAPHRIYGLSPHVRGNRSRTRRCRCPPGSIPACAGEPSMSPTCSSLGKVYPRMCGGTPRRVRNGTPDPGLSPHVRGNQAWASVSPGVKGSIPACAGEPSGAHCTAWRTGVYPRMCGGTTTAPFPCHDGTGLSPHVRGNHDGVEALEHRLGSIPACAGEPSAGTGARCESWVYPRMCGGTV